MILNVLRKYVLLISIYHMILHVDILKTGKLFEVTLKSFVPISNFYDINIADNDTHCVPFNKKLG